jgi:cell division protein FtsI/penicillin-binding protein 2
MKSRAIIIIISTLLIVVFGLLGWRLFRLQYYHVDDYSTGSKKQQHALITQKPQRGIIVDSRGRILAASNKIETIFAEPRAIADVKEVAMRLQQILDFPGDEICRIIYESKNPGFAEIKTGIAAAEREAIRKAKIRGIGVQSSWQRHYPMAQLTPHTIGFVGTDQTGLAGIELKYDGQLRGTEGRNVIFVDALRQPIGMKEPDTIVKDGFGLILTLDATIQQFTRDALSKQYKAYQAESAVAIVMDPWTGAILAMVSLPDFDPANLSTAGVQTFRNRALTDPFEPGSVFKPIVAALALDAGIIDYKEKIFCENGGYRGKGFARIGEFGNHQFGDLSVRDILVKSSNIGMAKIGQRMDRKKLYEGLKLFGFGTRIGIDLPGEETGLLYPVRKWTNSSVTRIPFGHEIAVTALQIARAYCTLANGGRLVRPHMVRAIIDNTGKVTKLKQPQNLPGHIIKPEVANWIVRKALTGVVKEGTGKRAASKKWEVFGKTGTANIAMSDQKGYDQANYVSSFTGGAPADRPEVVILVSIRKPDTTLAKGYSGGMVAAPVFKEILEKTLNYLHRHNSL